MAALPSLVAPGYGYQVISPGSVNLGAGTATWSPVMAVTGGVGKGTLGGSGAVSISHGSLTAMGLSYFAAQLYGHIHVFPSVIALGNLLSSQTRQVEVWNARMDAQLLVAISATNADGVGWSGPPAPPTTFGPLESRFYDFTISNLGSAALNATFGWQFAAEQPGLTVTATRVIAVTIEPDWAESPEEILEWKTDLLRAYAGNQQRVKLRGKPRRRVAFTYLLEELRKGSRFQSLVWGWQQRIFAVPVWMDQDKLGADLPLGSTSFAVSTLYRDYAVDGLVLLWRSYLEFEVVEVASFTSTTVTLKKPTQAAWTKGARVIPMRLGRMPKELEWARHTSTIAHVRVDWSLDPATGLGGNRTAATGFPVYQGYEVLLEAPDWGQELNEQAERDMDIVDFETGAVALDAHTSGPEYTRPFHWVVKGRQAIAKALAFFATREGRAVPFWLPAASKDFEQAQDAAAGDLTIQVKDIQYALYYAVHPNRRDLVFFPRSGSPVLRRVVAAAAGAPGLESITLDQSFGQIRKTTDWKAISFLTFVNLEHDSLRITWETDDMVQISFRVREVLL